MAKTWLKQVYHIVIYIKSHFMRIIRKLNPWNHDKPNPKYSLPCENLPLNISSKLRSDSNSIRIASIDFGKIITSPPLAVLYPSHINDIIHLIKFSYNSSTPFPISARGHAHSVRGQAMSPNGVVTEMSSLKNHYTNNNNANSGIRVLWSSSLGFYADVGGEQLWIDVLRATVEHGLAPVSWTDYLYLSVGGTLSNAGISGQTFRYGPQITNVHEMDVITGKGELLTCSKNSNSELFYAVLGGLGQFGIITRARIVLDKAPKRVKWIRMLYDDFSVFTSDQEHLISLVDGVDYLEGSLIMDQINSSNNWRSSSFFLEDDQSKIASLVSEHGIIYCLEAVKYYDDSRIGTVDEEVQVLVEGLNFNPGFVFKKDVSFIEFLNRVRAGEVKLESEGQWDVPHPWLNLFVPKSRIMDFHAGVLVNIIHAQNKTTGPVLVYPTIRKMWDDMMSAVTPDEDIFYSVGLLHSGGVIGWEVLDAQNREILEFCEKFGSEIKQYLPHYNTKQEWMKHFGEKKWKVFQDNKYQFDPKMILAPGQIIFNSL